MARSSSKSSTSSARREDNQSLRTGAKSDASSTHAAGRSSSAASHTSAASGRAKIRTMVHAVGVSQYLKRRSTFHLLDQDGALPTKLKFGYANPGFATTSLSFLISVYATDFYTSLGAQLAFLSFFTALARSLDVMTDPLMGWLSDSTRSKHGRRRPYMFLGCTFYAVFFILLFSPPKSVEGNASSFWFGAFYPIFYLFDTFTNVPYEALGPELSDSYEERNKIFFVKKIINFMGTLFAAAAPAGIAAMVRKSSEVHKQCNEFYPPSEPWNPAEPAIPEDNIDASKPRPDIGKCPAGSGEWCFYEKYSEDEAFYYEAELELLEDHCFSNSTLKPTASVEFAKYNMAAIDSQRTSFTIVAIIFGLWFILTMMYLVFIVSERQASSDKGPVPLVPSILRSFKNRAFRPLLAGWALDGLALSALVSMFPFFVRYIIIPDGVVAQGHGTNMSPQVCMGLCVFALLLAAVFSSPMWLWIAGKLGKYKTWLLYNMVNAVTNLLYAAPAEGDPMMTIVISLLNGIPVGGQFLIDSILADVIDYDEFLNGVRCEGAFSVFATLIPKFVAIPAGALPLAVINMLGFIPPVEGVAQPQDASVKFFIRFVFVFLPATCCIVSFLIKRGFPIKTKEMTETISKGIEAHMNGEPATDPITGASVEILVMTQEQEDKIWVFENYSAPLLKEALQSNSADPVIKAMRNYLIVAISLFVFFLTMVISFFGLLLNPKASIVPIISVIGAGISLCFLGVSVMRYRDALKLGRLMEEPETKELVQILLEHKEQGQRAGDNVDGKQRPVEMKDVEKK
eukprot:GFYU01015269.1.p1 GENE.GFYU01015269.1~~GFYU01015269.1.p1  ORF type:complete len:809 (-),score=267.89 GFYU01015269.1:148-2538(-)